MKTNYAISIPKPCHEDWSKMTPNEKGRFCQSCSKTVVDFTKMDVDEIQKYIHNNKNQRICGHIKQSQLSAVNLRIPETVFNQTWNFNKLFLLALLLAMGTTLLNCSDNNDRKQKISTIEVVQSKTRNIDTLVTKCKIKEVHLDSTTSKEKKPVIQKIKEKEEIIEGLMIMGDMVETEVKPIHQDSIKEVKPIDEAVFDIHPNLKIHQKQSLNQKKKIISQIEL